MKIWDAVLGGGGIILGLAAFAQAQTFPKMPDGTPGPSLFPQILGVMLAITGAIIVVQSVRPHRDEGQSYTRDALLKAGLVLVVIAVYVAVVQRVGFLITALLVTGSLMFVLGVRWRILLPTTIALVIASRILFQEVLRVPLPVGIWGG
jgi:putative tricarboxylic transport membrane protein